ncbi:cyclic di-GMP phosphodiesterase response regulator RpfG [Comamonadaceae bacterium OS-1]|nr:cyclic di-GMP phosphodiesterase response regulator RpfG [Comamonadaceae bacterium OS-1]
MDVVIVDDVDINLMLLNRLMDQVGGCRVHSFLRPVEALAFCQTHLPDLLLVDYLMPELDGISLVRQFRAIAGREDIPVLMVTASDERAVRVQALEAGANDFLSKPLDRTEFFARTRNMLALRRSQTRLANRALWLQEEVAKATAEMRLRDSETIACISRIAEYRDPETGLHTQRMAHYSLLIAQHLGLPADTQQLLFDAAPLHDVGKVGIPDSILLKPGKLTPEEFETMKTHSSIGHQALVVGHSQLMQMAATIAISHHEKFDGSGYPAGLVGEAIPLAGRIVAVADVFDALTSARPYKPAWPVERALQLLRDGAGSHFDPVCVDAFMAQLDAVLATKARLDDPAHTA